MNRDNQILIRVKASEKRMIEQAAEICGEATSVWVRQALRFAAGKVSSFPKSSNVPQRTSTADNPVGHVLPTAQAQSAAIGQEIPPNAPEPLRIVRPT